jgi:hypothetical protein
VATQVKALIDAGGDPSKVNEDVLVKYWTAEYHDGKQRLGHGRLGHGSIAYAIPSSKTKQNKTKQNKTNTKQTQNLNFSSLNASGATMKGSTPSTRSGNGKHGVNTRATRRSCGPSRSVRRHRLLPLPLCVAGWLDFGPPSHQVSCRLSG